MDRGKNVIVLVLAAIALVVTGCAEVSLKSPSAEVKTFFVAGTKPIFGNPM
jgi:hypothetical protein